MLVRGSAHPTFLSLALKECKQALLIDIERLNLKRNFIPTRASVE